MAVAGIHRKGDAVVPMTAEEKKVIFASSLGTIFEWYDFYLFGVMSAIIAKNFFSALDPATRDIFTLMAFAAGFAVRPFGAIVFGRLGDIVGRKYTFLITIMIMGVSTFIVGVIPNYAAIGIAAPIILISLRLLQGLALGGEYGGAATYVAEHAPHTKRGAYTSWIQTTATVGLLLALMVILATRTYFGEEKFAEFWWRLPYLLSIILLGVSLWIRLSLSESPAFQKMKSEGKTSKAPLSESFGQWKNLKFVLLALIGLTAGQAVVWYTGQFYALFFLQSALKVDGPTANILIAVSLIIGTPFFIFFGSLSDKIGRKPIIMAGCLIAALTYFPIFKAITHYANPALEAAVEKSPITVVSDPANCSFQFNPTGTKKFTSSCDVAKSYMAGNGLNYNNEVGAAGTTTKVKIGDKTIESYDVTAVNTAVKPFADKVKGLEEKIKPLADKAKPQLDDAKKLKDAVTAKPDDADSAGKLEALKSNADYAAYLDEAEKSGLNAAKADVAKAEAPRASFNKGIAAAIKEAGYPAKAAPIPFGSSNWLMLILLLTIMVIYVTMVYGPIAAMLVELFPTKIRYTSMSLPYHIGNGWFGGFLPATAFAIVAGQGNIYSGLWYPIIIAGITFVVGMLFVKETKDVDIHAEDIHNS